MNRIYNLPLIEFHPWLEIQDERRILLVTSEPAWQSVKRHFPKSLKIFRLVLAGEATLSRWQADLDGLTTHEREKPEAVYAVGGGLAVDEAKYLASQIQRPLICLPTALSVDAFFTWASGIRKDNCVQYIETKPPDQVILDLNLLTTAPPEIRAAGICDVLSIATGCWDWQYAEGQGKNPPGMEWISYVYANAQSILQGALDCAEAAGTGDPQGLKQLCDCLCLEVQLCNQIGHSRPEEGSEHYFAYAAEFEISHRLPHAYLVGPGILTMAQFQDQDINPLKKALLDCHVPLNSLQPTLIQHILGMLPDYCIRHQLPFGIAHTLNEPQHNS